MAYKTATPIREFCPNVASARRVDINAPRGEKHQVFISFFSVVYIECMLWLDQVNGITPRTLADLLISLKFIETFRNDDIEIEIIKKFLNSPSPCSRACKRERENTRQLSKKSCKKWSRGEVKVEEMRWLSSRWWRLMWLIEKLLMTCFADLTTVQQLIAHSAGVCARKKKKECISSPAPYSIFCQCQSVRFRLVNYTRAAASIKWKHACKWFRFLWSNCTIAKKNIRQLNVYALQKLVQLAIASERNASVGLKKKSLIVCLRFSFHWPSLERSRRLHWPTTLR